MFMRILFNRNARKKTSLFAGEYFLTVTIRRNNSLLFECIVVFYSSGDRTLEMMTAIFMLNKGK